MNSNMLLSAILLLGWLVLIGGGIRRRREPAGKIALQAGLWVLIIALVWVVASIGLRLR